MLHDICDFHICWPLLTVNTDVTYKRMFPYSLFYPVVGKMVLRVYGVEITSCQYQRSAAQIQSLAIFVQNIYLLATVLKRRK